MKSKKELKVNLKPVKMIYPKGMNFDPNNEFYIFSCESDSDDIERHPTFGNFSISGNMQRLDIGMEYVATLTKKEDRDYSYEVESIYQELPSSGYKQRDFFRAILTEHQFKALYDAYGYQDDLIEKFKNDEIDITKVRGLGEESYKKVKDKIMKTLDYQVLLSELSKYGVTFNTVVKLVEMYGSSELAVQKVKNNPYSLAKLKGFGFVKADTIAKNMSMEDIKIRLEQGEITKEQANLLYVEQVFKSPFRIQTGILHLLNQNQNEGHTFIFNEELIKQGYELLQVANELIIKEIINLHNDNLIFYDENRVALIDTYETEEYIAEWITEKNKNSEGLNFDVEDFISRMEAKYNIKLTDQQKGFFYNVKEHSVHLLVGYAGCVDKDTEFFNGEKWKKISDYEVGEKVLQYHKDGTTSLTNPARYIKLPETEFNVLKTKMGGVNQVVSNDHTLVYRTSRGNVGKIDFAELQNRHDRTDRGFIGKFIPSFNYSGEGLDLSDENIKVMIMVMADGHFPCGNNNCILRLKKERKTTRARKLLDDAQITYKEKYEISTGFTIIKFKAPMRTKVYDTYWYRATQEQLRIITEEVLKWDGSIGAGGRRSFNTIDKNSADFIQFAFSATGYRSSIRIDDRVGQPQGKYIRKSICYTVLPCKNKNTLVSIMSRNPEDKLEIKKTKSLDGYKYCFTVDSGMWVMRRENTICITGNCGKSYMQKLLKELLNELGKTVKWLAPTGSASKVLSSYVEDNATTVHRAIGYGSRDSNATSSKDIEEDYIVVDETSMLDVFITKMLLGRIKNPKARVLFLGDPYQIPSVQAGLLLHDMVECDILPCTKLDAVFRQKEGGALDVATNIRLGNKFIDNNATGEYKYGKDFKVVCIEKDQMIDGYLYYYKKYLEKYKPEEIMVLSVKKNGDLGTIAINRTIQNLVNPQSPMKVEIPFGEENVLREQDYIINIKNTYDIKNNEGYEVDIVNGDKGIVYEIIKDWKPDKHGQMSNLIMDFDDEEVEDKNGIYTRFDTDDVKLDLKDTSQLLHAWCLTAHKSQGSSSKAVIIIADGSHSYNLNANILYVAVTRLTVEGVLICQPEVINRSMKKVINLSRNTFLQELIKREYKKINSLEFVDMD